MYKITIIILLTLGALSGCEKVQQANENLTKLTNKVVTKYCSTPKKAREALHLTVKKAIAPNEISISCAEDIKS